MAERLGDGMVGAAAAVSKRWQVFEPDPDALAKLCAEPVLPQQRRPSPLLARLLLRRGLGAAEEARAFLSPSLSRGLRSPLLFPDMDRAVSRLIQALERRESIFVYGDYDVDGITGSAQLLLFFRELGVSAALYIPDRLKEGYGLNERAMRAIAAQGGKVLITADCGAASHKEISLAQSLGIDVIVCDHHQVPEVRERLNSFLPQPHTQAYKQIKGYARSRETSKREGTAFFTQALEMVGDIRQKRSVVLASEAWHPGVIGIVASRLVEVFYRPTILIALDGALGKGSGRSPSPFHLYQGVKACQELLESFGGHRQAAGLSIRAEYVSQFIEKFEEVAREQIKEEDLVPIINVDAELDLRDLTFALLEEMRMLEPCGQGNSEPVFLARGVEVVSSRVVGGESPSGKRGHLKLSLLSAREGNTHATD